MPVPTVSWRHCADSGKRHEHHVLARGSAGAVPAHLLAICSAQGGEILMSAEIEFGLLLAAFLCIVGRCAKPLGGYIAAVMEGKSRFAHRAGGPFEAFLYRVCGVDPAVEMAWPSYAISTAGSTPQTL